MTQVQEFSKFVNMAKWVTTLQRSHNPVYMHRLLACTVIICRIRYIHVCAHTHAYTHTHAHIHPHTHTYTHTYM